MEQRHAECATTGQPVEFEVSDEQAEGGVTWHVELVPLATTEGGVARIFGTAIDLTEARRLEEQLREAQKMQAVGQLAGGVAHDFNNLLTAVLGNIELVLSSEEDARCRRLLQGALRAAERGAELTRQLLAYSRRQRLQEESVDLNERIRGMLDLLRRTLGPAITIEQRLDAALWRVRADATQLELAILNLAINARDAMPEGGVLIIETMNLPESGVRRPKDLPVGEFVSIMVRDHGVGMSETVRAKAFEPFFTTKEVGKGSGLGLAQVYAFAEQSGGRAQIASRLGRGTTVTLLLPRSTVEVETRAAAEAIRPRSGSGKVLIVDDEPEVREFAATSLRELGYEVAEASGGRVALEMLDRDLPVDLLILDYAMPGMSGLEVMQAARARRPGLPLLLITGYAAGNLAETLGPGAAVLHKPFRQAELGHAVERMLINPRKVRDAAT
jgi:signal transduction histidine kinase